MNSQYLALELFHILYINHLQYDYQNSFWIGNVNVHNSHTQLVKDKQILHAAALFVSGINKQPINTQLAQHLIAQIQCWSIQSQGRCLKVFNPDLGAVRFIPASVYFQFNSNQKN